MSWRECEPGPGMYYVQIYTYGLNETTESFSAVEGRTMEVFQFWLKLQNASNAKSANIDIAFVFFADF